MPSMAGFSDAKGTLKNLILTQNNLACIMITDVMHLPSFCLVQGGCEG